MKFIETKLGVISPDGTDNVPVNIATVPFISKSETAGVGKRKYYTIIFNNGASWFYDNVEDRDLEERKIAENDFRNFDIKD